MKGKVVAAAVLTVLLTCQAVQADSHAELQEQIRQQSLQLEQLQTRFDRLGAGEEIRDNDFRVYWSNGLRFKTYDDSVEMRIGGRLHNDWTWIGADSAIRDEFTDTNDGVQFRRARLYIRGDAHDFMHWRLQFDFAGSDVAFRDVYAAFTDILPFRVAVGQFKEPFSLDELTSSNNITFIERALPTAFAPSRNVGIMFSDSVMDQQMTWAAGVFRETDDRGRAVASSGYNATGRVTYTPIYENEGADVLHLGAAYTYKNPQDNEYRVRQRPEAGITERFIDTQSPAGQDISTDNVGILGLETAWVNGPFSLQGEYMKAMADGKGAQQDVDFDGWYVQGSYWLTGENRNYSRGSGTFGYVNPIDNFGKDGGLGAWELAARYSELDLNDKNIEGGKLENITVGLNWHLNPNARVMWNYVNADRKQIGKADIYMMRLQVHF